MFGPLTSCPRVLTIVLLELWTMPLPDTAIKELTITAAIRTPRTLGSKRGRATCQRPATLWCFMRPAAGDSRARVVGSKPVRSMLKQYRNPTDHGCCKLLQGYH